MAQLRQSNIFNDLNSQPSSSEQADQQEAWGDAWRRRISSITAHLAASISLLHPTPSSPGIVINPEIQKALRAGEPVVALESTIISHGMPYPQNLRTAIEVEAVVRANGAIPATIAIIEGVPHVGLTERQLHLIAEEGPRVHKTSRRDLAYVVAMRLNGATTVSCTMLLAARAGISVFVTGGLGGVHRGGESSMDVSADLTELGRTPVTVICAGVKTVLDIPRTLEYLETQGVPVVAYGADEFPAFFTARSGCRAPCRVNTPVEAAQLIHAQEQLQLNGGIVIGVPVPQEQASGAAKVEAAIQTALKEASRGGVKGPAVTPFLLKRVQELTGGASLEINIRLVKNNAAVGAQIAAALVAKDTQRLPAKDK
eukprot:jgi/Botrbrau1/16883/Bobra.150_2s0099.1